MSLKGCEINIEGRAVKERASERDMKVGAEIQKEEREKLSARNDESLFVLLSLVCH